MAHRKAVAGLWRRRFLAALARTANARLAAEMAGVDRSTAYALRKRDAGFAAAWPRALRWGRARVKGEGRPVFPGGRPRAAAGPRGALDPRPLKVRRSRHGGTETVRCGEGRQSPESDAVFFAHLASGRGVRRSADSAGFSANALYERRMIDPGFAARWELAKQQGVARNDMLLIDSVPRTLEPEIGEAAEELPKPTIAEAIQIQRLYHGLQAARDSAGPRPDPRFARPTEEESVERIARKIEAIRRHRTAQKLGEGWKLDDSGNLIPPGWVREARPS